MEIKKKIWIVPSFLGIILAITLAIMMFFHHALVKFPKDISFINQIEVLQDDTVIVNGETQITHRFVVSSTALGIYEKLKANFV